MAQELEPGEFEWVEVILRQKALMCFDTEDRAKKMLAYLENPNAQVVKDARKELWYIQCGDRKYLSTAIELR